MRHPKRNGHDHTASAPARKLCPNEELSPALARTLARLRAADAEREGTVADRVPTGRLWGAVIRQAEADSDSWRSRRMRLDARAFLAGIRGRIPAAQDTTPPLPAPRPGEVTPRGASMIGAVSEESLHLLEGITLELYPRVPRFFGWLHDHVVDERFRRLRELLGRDTAQAPAMLALPELDEDDTAHAWYLTNRLAFDINEHRKRGEAPAGAMEAAAVLYDLSEALADTRRGGAPS